MCHLLFTEDPPKSLPSMSILKPSGGKGPEVCLAESFGNKTSEMEVTPSDTSGRIDISPAVISTKSKTYYFAYFKTTGEINTCSFQGKSATKQTDNPPTQPSPKGKAQTSSMFIGRYMFFYVRIKRNDAMIIKLHKTCDVGG